MEDISKEITKIENTLSEILSDIINETGGGVFIS
jgi:hypothetical protein